ncbi:MAG: GNAT family N-acetyltransferase [Cyclobacteriaceae bacterium]
MILYRPMVAGDIPAGLALCRAAGWNQTVRDWELFLYLSPEGCRVAVDDEGEVVGTVATIRYEDHFSWIGMVLVNPERHRQGIGIQLLRESLQILSGEDTVKLDATPAGRHIYVQLDFVDEYKFSRMQNKNVSSMALEPSPARLIQKRDLAAILEADREIFGASRKRILEWLLEGGKQFAFLIENENGIQGYCMGRVGHNFTHIGPVICQNVATAIALVSAALRNCQGAPVVLDALHHSPEWIRWLSSIGFEEQRQLIRMYRGTNAYPGIPAKQFAILGPEFG